MKNLFLTTVILLSVSFSISSQTGDNQLYKYSNVSVDVKAMLDAPEGYVSINFTLEKVKPLKLGGEYHKNLVHGLSTGGSFLIPKDNGVSIIGANLSYVFGYNYPFSRQLFFFPSIKPTLNFTAIVDENEDAVTDFSFSGLLGLKARYFFSEEGKWGMSAETLTSFEGGFGFLIGLTWRNAL